MVPSPYALETVSPSSWAFLLAPCRWSVFDLSMATLTELGEQALSLPDNQRAALAACLLDSLPAVLHDEDGGLAEAVRRDAGLESDPSVGMTLHEFKAAFGR